MKPTRKQFSNRVEWRLSNGQRHRHREDGPAIEYADGSKEWWVNGEHTTRKKIDEIRRKKKIEARRVRRMIAATTSHYRKLELED